MPWKIFIDPGHGGTDPGAVSVGLTKLQESACTLKIAHKVGAILADNGLQIGYTRTGDTNVSLAQRCTLANTAKADCFVSIHINSAFSTSAAGTETFALTAGGEAEKLAKSVQKSLVQAIKRPDRGVKFANFAVLRDTRMPAALVEVCFISNPTEEALLKSGEFLEQAAMGIAHGILSHLGITVKEVKEAMINESDIRKIVREEITIFKKGADSKPSIGPLGVEFAEAKDLGITDGTRPQGLVTREEAAVMALRANKL